MKPHYTATKTDTHTVVWKSSLHPTVKCNYFRVINTVVFSFQQREIQHDCREAGRKALDMGEFKRSDLG